MSMSICCLYALQGSLFLASPKLFLVGMHPTGDQLYEYGGCRFCLDTTPDDKSEWVADVAESAARHSFMNCLAALHMYGDFDESHHSEVLRRMLPTQGPEERADGGCLRVDLQLPRESMHKARSMRNTLQVHHGATANYRLAADLMKGLPGSEVRLLLCSWHSALDAWRCTLACMNGGISYCCIALYTKLGPVVQEAAV